LLIVVARVAPRAATSSLDDEADRGWLFLKHSQGPAPAGQLAGNGDVGDGRLLPAFEELQPPLVKSSVALVAPGPGCDGSEVPPIAHGLARNVTCAVVPRVLDQKPSYVGVAAGALSGGFAQGWGFLVLEGPEDFARFSAAATPEGYADRWLAANIVAPLLIVPHSNKDAYLDRYAEPDKGHTDRSEA
jgi:hypothetical protein